MSSLPVNQGGGDTSAVQNYISEHQSKDEKQEDQVSAAGQTYSASPPPYYSQETNQGRAVNSFHTDTQDNLPPPPPYTPHASTSRDNVPSRNINNVSATEHTRLLPNQGTRRHNYTVSKKCIISLALGMTALAIVLALGSWRGTVAVVSATDDAAIDRAKAKGDQEQLQHLELMKVVHQTIVGGGLSIFSALFWTCLLVTFVLFFRARK